MRAAQEDSLVSYPPDVLMLRSAMPRVIEDGVRRLLDEVRGISVVVGLPEYVDGDGTTIYNAAYVIRAGQIIARTRKQLLPNYGVFDARRHFSARDRK